MNKENFVSLCSVLSGAGIQGLEHKLLQYICCRPLRFTLLEKIPFNEDVLYCQIHFVKMDNAYSADYYEASLTRHLPMPERSINGVSLQGLEAAMLVIDWQPSENRLAFRFADETTWAREKSIDAVMSELLQISAVEDGKFYADALKLRFWPGTLMEQLTSSLTAVRS
ncbi:MAG: hypothetical protein ABI581_05875, partial [Sediminibacterium sp.]